MFKTLKIREIFDKIMIEYFFLLIKMSDWQQFFNSYQRLFFIFVIVIEIFYNFSRPQNGSKPNSYSLIVHNAKILE